MFVALRNVQRSIALCPRRSISPLHLSRSLFLRDKMWLIALAALGLVLYLVYKFVAFYHLTPNPFIFFRRNGRAPYVHDQKKRDAVLKQGFSQDKVPDDLDAIVIGSGIGGLSVAALLSKAGQRVLVLEQHDVAGGCTHTFSDKGYEFDVGIHYIGEMAEHCKNRIFLDSISDHQIEWVKLAENYDVVTIGYGEEMKRYPVCTGHDKRRAQLKEQFPGEDKAIDEYMDLHKGMMGDDMRIFLKLLPRWVANLMMATGLAQKWSTVHKGDYVKSLESVVKRLTQNKSLQTVFTYCWGDYGTPPSRSTFTMLAEINNHFQKNGSYYPVGGSSEIAYNVVPVIERSGGKVLVRADVKDIVVENGRAVGVTVARKSGHVVLKAKRIISSAGLYNTFQRLLPPQVASQSYYSKLCSNIKPGLAAMNVFIGLNASNEELGLTTTNTWSFTDSDASLSFDDYASSGDVEDVLNKDIPLVFTSFPSAKDPNWKDLPSRAGKSTCAVVTISSWDWFKKYENEMIKKRGDEYEGIKKTLGYAMIEQVCKIYPQIRDHIDYVDIGTPVTNKYYIAQPHGEIYGLDHSLQRFSLGFDSQLRPETDVPGLYLTGQDILSCGFTGAMFGGLLTATSILGLKTLINFDTLCSRMRQDIKFRDSKKKA